MSVGERVTPTWMTFRDCSSMMKTQRTNERRGKSPGENRKPTYQQRDSAGRSPTSAHLDEVGELASCISGSCGRHTRIPSLSNSPRMRSAPQSRLFLTISLINAIVSGESFGCLESAFDVCFQNKRKSSRCHPAQGLRLHNEERLLPGPHHPRKKHQEDPIGLPAGRSFDLPMQDDELLP